VHHLITVSGGLIGELGWVRPIIQMNIFNTHYHSILRYCSSLVDENRLDPIRVRVRTYHLQWGQWCWGVKKF